MNNDTKINILNYQILSYKDMKNYCNENIRVLNDRLKEAYRQKEKELQEAKP